MNTVVVCGKPRALHGWKPDVPDARDFVFKAPAPGVGESALNWTLAIRDQGQKGTCTAHASLEAAGYLWVRDGKPDPVLSRLFTYWVSRVKMENESASVDSGAQIRDVINGLRKYGSCPESMWHYSDDDTQFTLQPTQECFDAAALHKALFFYRCPDLNTIKASIAQGFPVVFGFPVPNSFMGDETAATGIVKMPTPTEGFEGGHCMLFTGFSNSRQQLDGPNSWSRSWGDNGFFHMPYGMVDEGFVGDCWTIRRVQE